MGDAGCTQATDTNAPVERSPDVLLPFASYYARLAGLSEELLLDCGSRVRPPCAHRRAGHAVRRSDAEMEVQREHCQATTCRLLEDNFVLARASKMSGQDQGVSRHESVSTTSNLREG
jgi:hypothetical protein